LQEAINDPFVLFFWLTRNEDCGDEEKHIPYGFAEAAYRRCCGGGR
jgi:hypothetical protein